MVARPPTEQQLAELELAWSIYKSAARDPILPTGIVIERMQTEIDVRDVEDPGLVEILKRAVDGEIHPHIVNPMPEAGDHEDQCPIEATGRGWDAEAPYRIELAVRQWFERRPWAEWTWEQYESAVLDAGECAEKLGLERSSPDVEGVCIGEHARAELLLWFYNLFTAGGPVEEEEPPLPEGPGPAPYHTEIGGVILGATSELVWHFNAGRIGWEHVLRGMALL